MLLNDIATLLALGEHPKQHEGHAAVQRNVVISDSVLGEKSCCIMILHSEIIRGANIIKIQFIACQNHKNMRVRCKGKTHAQKKRGFPT